MIFKETVYHYFKVTCEDIAETPEYTIFIVDMEKLQDDINLGMIQEIYLKMLIEEDILTIHKTFTDSHFKFFKLFKFKKDIS